MPKTSFAHRRRSAAIERCQEAIRRSPDSFEAHFNLGMAYTEHKCYDQALEVWQQAARLKPGNGFVRLNIGTLYAEQGRWEQARQAYHEGAELFREAIQRFPDRVEGYYGLGMAYGHLNQYDLAIEAFELALLIKPEMADIHFGLAVACMEQGRLERAVTALEETVRLDPNHARARDYLTSARELREKQAASPPSQGTRNAFSSSGSRRRRAVGPETSSRSQKSEPTPGGAEEPLEEDDAVLYMQSCMGLSAPLPDSVSAPETLPETENPFAPAEITQREMPQEEAILRALETMEPAVSTDLTENRTEAELTATRSRVINRLVSDSLPVAAPSASDRPVRRGGFRLALLLLTIAFLAGALTAIYRQQYATLPQAASAPAPNAAMLPVSPSLSNTPSVPPQEPAASVKKSESAEAPTSPATSAASPAPDTTPPAPKSKASTIVPTLPDTASAEPPPSSASKTEENPQKQEESGVTPPAPVRKRRMIPVRRRRAFAPARKTKATHSAYDKGVDALLNRLP